MVEAMANSVEYYLIDGLAFKLSPGASQAQRNMVYIRISNLCFRSGREGDSTSDERGRVGGSFYCQTGIYIN